MPKFPMLCAMMFLQFFVWGSWYVTAGTFVPAWEWLDSASGEELQAASKQGINAWVYSAGPIAALISPLFLGLVADRFFASQRVLAIMHLFGAALMLNFIPGAIEAKDATWFEWYVLAYMLCYMPTLGLSNTVAFSHIATPEKQFPIARVFGTLGWIAAGTVVSKFLAADEDPVMFQVAGWSSLAMAVLSWMLPHTPPPAAGKKASLAEILGLGAISMIKERTFAVFLICSFLMCIPLAGYYSQGNSFLKTAFQNPGFVNSFGQWAEVLFMLVMPLFFARLGVKWMLAAGMFAWVVRYGLFSAAAGTVPIEWMMLGGVLLHGICYDFFFVTGQIYTEQKARPEIRGQAQSFLVIVTQGLGMFIGAQVMGRIVQGNSPEGGQPDWGQIWLLPCLGAAAILLVFVLLFRGPKGAPAKLH